MDWDNLRFFLELARTGRLLSAARRLEVDQATVSRRIQALEKQLGRSLFARSAAGMGLTDAGRELLASAEAMEAAAGTVQAPGETGAGELAGVVRVGSTEGFGATILAPHLAMFAAAHPLLSIDLVAVPAIVSISRREADIVISLERPARGPYLVVQLCEYALRLYASEAYLAASPPLHTADDLREHPLIGYVDDLLFSKELRFLGEVRTARAAQRFTLRSTSVIAQMQAVAAGAGLAVLPVFLARTCVGLRPVLAHELRFTRKFWMSMPAEMRNQRRMRATWDSLRRLAEESREILMGE